MGTMPTPMPAEAQPQAQIGPVGRVFGVLFSPGKTFEDIARKPSWLFPVILSTILGIGVAFALNQRVDWRDIASKRIEESSRASQLSAEQKERQLDISAKVSPIVAYVIGVCTPWIVALLVGAVMLGAFNLLRGANANFSTALGIVSHSYVVFLIHGLLFILILYLKPPGTVDIENPVASNLAAFFPQGTAKWIVTFGTGVDIFSIWTTILIGLGFATFNPRKLKTGGAIGIAFAVWAVWEALRTGFAWIFS